MLRKVTKIIFSRISIVIVLLCIQVAYFAFALMRISQYSQYITAILMVISVLMVLHIIGRSENPSFKLAWCIVILIFPLFGGFLYLVVRLQSSGKVFRERMAVSNLIVPPLKNNDETLKALSECDADAAIEAGYLVNKAGFPVYNASGVTYFPLGELFFEELKVRLKQAEKYIFMEYFIIAPGKMWDEIVGILTEKAAKGVDVRVMYDSMGSLLLLPGKYFKKLESMGIKAVEFNKFRPTISTIQNNRDHRKICVVDGVCAFTGGINIGDEYINHFRRCGHWKDSGVLVVGEAVKSFEDMFCRMWNTVYKKPIPIEYVSDNYTEIENDGYLIPYCDTPWDDEYVSQSVYMNIINRAKNYLYITTPYFIVGDEFITALELAAKSGVDVRVITPHIWDKRFVYVTTVAFYERLIRAGIKVYEYTPGFIHAKMFLCDDRIATVGTANVDYRSMYMQYECGLWMCGCKAIRDIKDDMEDIISKSRMITLEECKKQPMGMRIIQRMIQLFAPLM